MWKWQKGLAIGAENSFGDERGIALAIRGAIALLRIVKDSQVVPETGESGEPGGSLARGTTATRQRAPHL